MSMSTSPDATSPENEAHSGTSDPLGEIVVVASNNHGKLAEIRSALPFAHWRFSAASELDTEWPSPEETGDTFEANARIKAVACRERFGFAALADDSGLEVDALDGAPGVYSARFAGPCADDAENNARLLIALADVPQMERTARFRCSIVFIAADGTETVATGTCEGRIGFERRGEHGFGYDPLFLPDATPGRSMAELTLAEKNEISHRGAALRDLRSKLVGE
jgi:XTP/dITP diphosphohydrolase